MSGNAGVSTLRLNKNAGTSNLKLCFCSRLFKTKSKVKLALFYSKQFIYILWDGWNWIFNVNYNFRRFKKQCVLTKTQVYYFKTNLVKYVIVSLKFYKPILFCLCSYISGKTATNQFFIFIFLVRIMYIKPMRAVLLVFKNGSFLIYYITFCFVMFNWHTNKWINNSL